MERGDPLRVAGMQPQILPPLLHTIQIVLSVGLNTGSQYYYFRYMLPLCERRQERRGVEEGQRT